MSSDLLRRLQSLIPWSSLKDMTFKHLVTTVLKLPRTRYRRLRDDPVRAKRIAKVAIALTVAVALTLPKPLSHFLGRNPFLLGTIAIYLFPIKTVGGQLVSTIIGLFGIVFGIAYSNFILFLADQLQDGDSEHIGWQRKICLLVGFSTGAYVCGWLRSKWERSYLGINFFTVVSMFALIRGINHFDYQFHAFFYSMFIGAGVSLAVCFLLWPEDRGKMLRTELLAVIRQAEEFVVICRDEIGHAIALEKDLGGLMAAEAALAASLHEANYEVILGRVAPKSLIPIHRCVQRIISLARVFNASMRRKNKTPRPGSRQQLSFADESCNYVCCIELRQALDATFAITLETIADMRTHVEHIYAGNKKPYAIDHQRLELALHHVLVMLRLDVELRTVKSLPDLGNAAFTDQLNTVICDVLDAIKDMARGIAVIETQRFGLIMPMRGAAHYLGVIRSWQNQSDKNGKSNGRSMVAPSEGYLLYMDSTTKWDRAAILISGYITAFTHSRHVKYAVKFTVAMTVLASFAFISNWHTWYDDLRCQLALISAMVAMETNRGMTIRTAVMKAVGALFGGLMAFFVVAVSKGHIAVAISLTMFVGAVIGHLLTNPFWAKTGTVSALAYNLIVGVAMIYPHQGPISSAFGRRLLTLPVGLTVALIVHMALFPYAARTQLVKNLSASLDSLHNLVFAIEVSDQLPSLESRFDALAQKASQRALLAKRLLPSTHYEFSVSGHWPYDNFERIVDKIFDVMDLIIGENSGEPILAFHLHGSRLCEKLSAKVLASMCNDLIVLSHTLSARLFLPRHDSMSQGILQDYEISMLGQLVRAPLDAPKRSYCDLGRLGDLVSEISYLREQIDDLVAKTQCPKNGLLPHLSYAVRKSIASRPGTPSNFPPPMGVGAWSLSRAPTIHVPDSEDGDTEVGVDVEADRRRGDNMV